MRIRRTQGLALVLAFALASSTLGVAVAAPSGDGTRTAVEAKKKSCKKKKKASDSASTAKKKKKCKKKKQAAAPVVRATLTWSGGGGSTDYDLYVFDGGTMARAVSNPIANSAFSANGIGATGTETFTDLAPQPLRSFSFGVCHQDGGNDGSSYSIQYVTADGVSRTDAQAGTGDGYNARYTGAAPPATNTFTCPA